MPTVCINYIPYRLQFVAMEKARAHSLQCGKVAAHMRPTSQPHLTRVAVD
jgi:hypothetical protein